MKKLLLTILLGMFLLTTVSAFEFDNVKDYNPITREVTITNAFGLGDVIGKARLNTPLNVYVGAGYQKVAEFQIEAYEDYNEALKQFTFNDMNNGRQKINRDYDLKYLTYEEVEVDDYETECFGEMNRVDFSYSGGCIETLIGSHIETREVWTKITPANLKKNDVLTVGVFTNVEVGDYVDWIPTIYGVEVEEWATWTASLNTDLEIYYKFDETSGTVAIDSTEQNNGTNSGATVNVAGKIGTAYDFELSDPDKVISDANSGITGANVFSMNAWAKSENNGAGEYQTIYALGTADSGAGNICYVAYDFNTWGNIWVNSWGNPAINSPSGVTLLNEWHMITVTYDGNNLRAYVDGTNIGNTTGTYSLLADSFKIGSIEYSEHDFDGDIDEVGLWSRTLTTDEIVQLYNSGIGITYTTDFSSDEPDITLNSPTVDINYTTPQSITFNFTAFDDINLTSVKFYVNDVLNQTNASGINNTDYLFTIGLNDGDYTIYGKATDNESQETNSSSIRIVINTTPNIQYTANTRIDNYNSTTSYLPIEVTVTEDLFEKISFNIDGTITNYTDSTRLHNVSMADGTYDYNVTVFTTTGKSNTTDTRTINIDSVNPSLLINEPSGLVTSNGTIFLNTTISDSNIDTCWYAYNGTNTTFTCTENLYFNTSYQNNITVYVNDTFGNVNSSTSTFYWNLKINALESDGTLISSTNIVIPDLGIDVNENPLTRTSTTILGTAETRSLLVNITDNNLYGIKHSANITFNTNQSEYNVTLTGKSLTLNFYHYNGTSANVNGYYTDGNYSSNFSDTNFTGILKNMVEGTVKVAWVWNESATNFTQYYEYDNDWITQNTENMTLLEYSDITQWIKVVDESSDPLNDVLVKSAMVKIIGSGTYQEIGQRFTGSEGDLGMTYFYFDSDTDVSIRFSKDGYTTKTYLMDMERETYTKDDPLIITLKKEEFVMYNGVLIIPSKIRFNSTTQTIGMKVYAPTINTLTYNTNYRIGLGYGNTTISLNEHKTVSFNLTKNTDFGGTDDLNITFWNGNELVNIITIKYDDDLDFSKFNQPSDLNDKTKIRLVWIGLIMVCAILGILIKGDEEDTGIGGYSKWFFMIGIFIVNIVFGIIMRDLLIISSLWVVMLTIKKWVGE